MRRSPVDVVVVGAGAAGLSAARVLIDAGLHVAIVEGRDRTGGRVHTLHDPRAPLPIELGAEFVHGPAPLTRAIVHERGLPLVAAEDERVDVRRGRIRPVGDLDVQLGAVFDHITADDLKGSLATFLARRPGGKTLAAARQLVREFVTGFHAADPDTVSLKSIVDGTPVDDDDALQSRLLSGQGSLIAALADGLHEHIELEHTVQQLRWRKGHVVIAGTHAGRAFERTAKHAVITVPVSVLQAGLTSSTTTIAALTITPMPQALRTAIQSFAMGQVVRVTFVFARRFWIEHAPRLAGVGFLHVGEGPFSMWWTTEPVASPQLVAWVGGPNAQALVDVDRQDVIARALSTLARQLDVPLGTVKEALVLAAHHDWSTDPFAGGAYSTVRVGGDDGVDALSRPVSSTLYFAGEATAKDGSSGTVEGAIASGRRAAQQLLRARR